MKSKIEVILQFAIRLSSWNSVTQIFQTSSGLIIFPLKKRFLRELFIYCEHIHWKYEYIIYQ